MRSVKEDLFTEEVFAFTPKGDLLTSRRARA
jgi:(p)ppGpp synthase/HD superfamily hydrolase